MTRVTDAPRRTGPSRCKQVLAWACQRSESQYVKAAVVANGGLDVADIRAHCQQHLVYYKRPETIFLLDALPSLPMGKIIYKELP